jgi:arylsulfatase
MSGLPRVNPPIADQPDSGPVAYDAKDPGSVFAPIEPLRPPAGAPDVLVVLLDDRGFGASITLGGPCAAPVMERLAVGGLGYNPFHTTALCALPDRRC